MAIQIGVLNTVIGEATATSADGLVRTLRPGDSAFAEELITTGPGGAIELCFADGSVMDLGRDSQVLLNKEFFFPSTKVVADVETDDFLTHFSSNNFLINADGDDILSGLDGDLPSTPHAVDSNDKSVDSTDVVDLADVISSSANQIAGVEHEGHLQIQVSNSMGVVKLIDFTTVPTADDSAARSVLGDLLSPDSGNDQIV